MEGSGSFLSGKKSNSASTIRVILISYFPSFSKKIAMPILVGMAILFLIFSLIICELMDARPAEQSLRWLYQAVSYNLPMLYLLRIFYNLGLCISSLLLKYLYLLVAWILIFFISCALQD